MFRFCATMNYTVHAVMYSYFALHDSSSNSHDNNNNNQVSERLMWAQRITALQCSQFVVCLIAIATGAYDRIIYHNALITYPSVLLSSFVLGSFLYLFLEFAEEKYAYRSQLRQFVVQVCHDIHVMVRFHSASTEIKQKQTQKQHLNQPHVPAWHRRDLSLEQRFQEATKQAAMLYGVAEQDDLMTMYGCYKQAKEGRIPVEHWNAVTSATNAKELAKLQAWKAVQELSPAQAQEQYIAVMDRLNIKSKEHFHKTMAKSKPIPTLRIKQTVQQQSNSILYPIKIVGHGRYLPKKVVTNEDIERMGGFELSVLEKKRTGVQERRFCDIDGGENLVQNGAMAIRAACAKAGIKVEDLDLIVGGFGGHQFLPDDASLVQRELGLGESGIRAFTVHATCLSFVVATEVAGSFMRDGKYKNVVVFASSISSVGIYKKDPHTAGLFGDGAAAVVLQPTSEKGCGVHGVHMETYGCGADACRIVGGGTFRPHRHPEHTDRMSYFSMDGQKTLSLVSKYARSAMNNFIPGLENGLDNLKMPGSSIEKVNIDWVVPHQASAVAIDSLALFGWEEDRILKTLHKYGNCVAASIPLTLCEYLDNETIKRGDRVLLCGTSAGLSIGSMLLTY